jgi:hypothetical protein
VRVLHVGLPIRDGDGDGDRDGCGCGCDVGGGFGKRKLPGIVVILFGDRPASAGASRAAPARCADRPQGPRKKRIGPKDEPIVL